jgi:hypothetical protein
MPTFPPHLSVGPHDKKGNFHGHVIEEVKQRGQGTTVNGVILFRRAASPVATPNGPQPVKINMNKSERTRDGG